MYWPFPLTDVFSFNDDPIERPSRDDKENAVSDEPPSKKPRFSISQHDVKPKSPRPSEIGSLDVLTADKLRQQTVLPRSDTRSEPEKRKKTKKPFKESTKAPSRSSTREKITPQKLPMPEPKPVKKTKTKKPSTKQDASEPIIIEAVPDVVPVSPPKFTFIKTPAAHLLMPRMQIREFCIRFEKLLVMPAKHLGILMNPMETPEYSSRRHLAMALLKMIDYADEPPIDPDEIRKTVKLLSQASEDSDDMWELVKILMSRQTHVSFEPKQPLIEPEAKHLHALARLIDLALLGEYIRSELTTGPGLLRSATAENTSHKLTCRIKCEVKKQKLQDKMSQFSETDDLAKWQSQWDSNIEKCKNDIHKLDVELWRQQRSAITRTKPLGTDCLNNTFWLFSHPLKVKTLCDLGTRIIIQPAKGKSCPACPSENESGCSICEHEPIDDRRKDPLWYGISTAEEASKLCEWINYHAKLKLGPKPEVIDGRSKVSRQGKKNPEVMAFSGQKSSTTSTVRDSTSKSARSPSDMNGKRATDAVNDKTLGSIKTQADQELLEEWSQISTLVKKIEDFAAFVD